MTRDSVQARIDRQKLVEGMVHGQKMPRQQLVETLVHRQHLAELEKLIEALPAAEVAAMLERLPNEDAAQLWRRIPGARENDVLWEMSDALRARLADVRGPSGGGSQINAFELVDGRLRQASIAGRRDLDGLKVVWIDLVAVSPAERARIGEHFGVSLRDPGDTTDLEVSSRFRIEENGDLHLHSNFLLDQDGGSRSVPVAFVLHGETLFSVRNEELPVFRLQRQRARARPGYVEDCRGLLLDLYGADVEYSADSLEDIYQTLSRVGRQVLSQTMPDSEAAAVLAGIAEEEDLNGRIRGNILDTQRAIAFLTQSRVLSATQGEDARQILRNIESLNSHTAFLFDKINFLMDATIGFININQNRRVTQLTVFGVVFMPINILAGIGGMSEFSMMTEGVPWPIAYGAFVVGAGLIGGATYVALKFFEGRARRR